MRRLKSLDRLASPPQNLGGNNVHHLLFDHFIVKMNFALVTNRNQTVSNSKEGVIAAHGNIFAGQHIRTSLTHQNRPGFGRTSRGNLDAEIFRVGISTVFTCTRRFFMCHN